MANLRNNTNTVRTDPLPAIRSLVGRHPRLEALAVALALLVALTGVAVLSLSRLDSALRSAVYFQSTGSEAPGLYGILKIAHGDQLYHDLTVNPTTLLFGYSFYLVYGGLARTFSLQDAQVICVSKAITTAGAAALTVGLIALTRRWWQQLPLLAQPRVIIIALILQFGPFLGWWPFTARPDVIAVGLELVGLVYFMRSCHPSLAAARDWQLALVFWALAPTFKQTAVTMAMGASLYLITQQRWRRALLIPTLIGFTAVVIPTLAWGQRYLSHAWVAPAVSPLTLHQALLTGRESLLTGAPVFLAGLLALRALKRSPALGPLATPFRLVFMVTLVAAVLLAAKNGSSRNYYLPFFQVCGLATVVTLSDVDLPVRRTAVVLQLLLALYGATAWAYIGAPGRVGAFRLPSISPELQRMVETICAAQPPRFVESSYYALPHASCEYPTAVIDWTFYGDAPATFPVFRVESVIAARGYGSLFVQRGSELHRLALRAGYQCHAPIAELIPCERPSPAPDGR